MFRPWPRSGGSMQVKGLRTALQNLDDEATYLAQDDASAACLVVERVLSAVSHSPLRIA